MLIASRESRCEVPRQSRGLYLLAARSIEIIARMRPWDHWYHVTVHTYGQWLRGDPRGWRARNHREHVDGDYKHPPPKGKYDQLFAQSKALLKRDPVKIKLE